jgi:hypothetical protein
MKPKPFSPLNHLTVPCVISLLLAGGASRRVRGPADPGAELDRGPGDPVMLWRLLVPADVHDTDTETERPQFRSLPASSFPAAGALGCGVITHS